MKRRVQNNLFVFTSFPFGNWYVLESVGISVILIARRRSRSLDRDVRVAPPLQHCQHSAQQYVLLGDRVQSHVILKLEFHLRSLVKRPWIRPRRRWAPHADGVQLVAFGVHSFEIVSLSGVQVEERFESTCSDGSGHLYVLSCYEICDFLSLLKLRFKSVNDFEHEVLEARYICDFVNIYSVALRHLPRPIFPSRSLNFHSFQRFSIFL